MSLENRSWLRCPSNIPDGGFPDRDDHVDFRPSRVARKPGDWDCPNCGFSPVFARRKRCPKCQTPKPSSPSSSAVVQQEDWTCMKCGVSNWARRKGCRTQGCLTREDSARLRKEKEDRDALAQVAEAEEAERLRIEAERAEEVRFAALRQKYPNPKMSSSEDVGVRVAQIMMRVADATLSEKTYDADPMGSKDYATSERGWIVKYEPDKSPSQPFRKYSWSGMDDRHSHPDHYHETFEVAREFAIAVEEFFGRCGQDLSALHHTDHFCECGQCPIERFLRRYGE